MSLGTLTFVVALVAAVLCARYYVLGVLDGDRLLARAAAIALGVILWA